MDRGGIALGIFLLTLVFAATGYVVAAAHLTFRDFGLGARIDFLELARSYPDLRIVRPDDARLAELVVGAFALVGLVASTALSGTALTRFGRTHFQGRRELRRNGFLGKVGTGFVLGKLPGPGWGAKRFLVSQKFPHALIVAPTGRGKTSGFVIPNLLTFRGSAVILDVKGESFEATARHRAGQGDAVFRFAPTDWADRRTHRYNPLLRIAEIEDQDQQQMELQLLATLFLQSDSDYVKGLLEGGIELFVAAGLLAFQRERPTLGEIYRIASAGGDKQVAYRACAYEVENEAARLIFMRLASTNQNTLTSYLSLLMTSGLSQWSNPAIDRATEVSDFDFRAIRRTPMSVYLVVAPNMVKPLAALIRLFFSDLIASLQTREPDETEPWPVMILLDEFNRLGKMPIVVESIETLRSYRGHLAIVTQTIPALDEIYGENTRRALQGNAGVKLYLTPSDEKTVEELSKAVGRTTKRVVTRSRAIGRNPFEGRSLSERTEEVALLPEDEARRMPLDDVVMVVDAQMPVRAKRIQYFADRYFRRIHAAQSGAVPFPRVEVRRGAEVEKPEAEAAPRPPSNGAQSPWARPRPEADGKAKGVEPEAAKPAEVPQPPGPLAASGLPANASIEMAKAGDGHGRIGASARKRAIKQKAAKDMHSDARRGGLGQKEQAIQDLGVLGRLDATKGYEEGSERMEALEAELCDRESGVT